MIERASDVTVPAWIAKRHRVVPHEGYGDEDVLILVTDGVIDETRELALRMLLAFPVRLEPLEAHPGLREWFETAMGSFEEMVAETRGEPAVS